MSKRKIWLIVAVVLMLVGGVLFAVTMGIVAPNFEELSTMKYQDKRYEFNEDFTDILLTTKTADITFAPAEDGKAAVVCHEMEKAAHEVRVKDGKLMIVMVDNRAWYEHIGISFDTPKLTVYLPTGAYGMLGVQATTGSVKIGAEFTFASIDVKTNTGAVTCRASATGNVKIHTSTGAIELTGASAGSLDLRVSTGRVTLRDVTCTGDAAVKVSTGRATVTNLHCGAFRSEGSTGDLQMTNVIATGRFDIERDTGDVKLVDCDAAEVCIDTDTGDVNCVFLSEKVVFAKTDTGRIDVPSVTSGGRCEIETDTGDIKVTIKR